LQDEVVRGREVFDYSWFPATVDKVVGLLSYIVEYFDQKVEGTWERSSRCNILNTTIPSLLL
jgi:hypothetical protein